MTVSFGVLGDGRQADETEDFAQPARVAFRAVTAEYLDASRNALIDIATEDEALTRLPVIAAVGAPALRRRLIEAWSGDTYFSVLAPTAWISGTAALGEGTLVAPQAVVSTRVVLGRHVLLNVAATVSHDSMLGDYVTVSPGVHIAGNCTIGDGVFLGVGASVSHGISIASGTVIGAGAVLVDDVISSGVYVGVPARRVRDQEGWLSAI
jgi:sugar O-acyltransferase (sialic acid O-acetyltransferase NeuD family)